MTWKRMLNMWWYHASGIVVGASFPWAGLMWIDGQPFDALVLIFNAILAWYFLKGVKL